MKRIILFSTGAFLTVLIILIIAAVYISFTIVKPTTEAINQNLAKFMARIVYIPEGIPSPIYDFRQTSYFWEMETPAGEVTAIRFSYTTAFGKSQNKIIAVLEMPELGDASIFTKVLPAVISDNQSLTAAQDPQKANLDANATVGYRRISLNLKPQTGQTVKITWEFDKKILGPETVSLYERLSIYPPSLLSILYSMGQFILSLISG